MNIHTRNVCSNTDQNYSRNLSAWQNHFNILDPDSNEQHCCLGCSKETGPSNRHMTRGTRIQSTLYRNRRAIQTYVSCVMFIWVFFGEFDGIFASTLNASNTTTVWRTRMACWLMSCLCDYTCCVSCCTLRIEMMVSIGIDKVKRVREHTYGCWIWVFGSWHFIKLPSRNGCVRIADNACCNVNPMCCWSLVLACSCNATVLKY